MAYSYSTAQICENGHLITSDISDGTQSKHCSKCGALALSDCTNCSSAIRGDAFDDGFFLQMNLVPSFCHDCGMPYEWTLRQVQAAKDLADEIEGIEDGEREKAKESFIALASDTPQTSVAVVRVKKLLNKAGQVTGSALRDILVGIATEAVKKQLGL